MGRAGSVSTYREGCGWSNQSWAGDFRATRARIRSRGLARQQIARLLLLLRGCVGWGAVGVSGGQSSHPATRSRMVVGQSRRGTRAWARRISGNSGRPLTRRVRPTPGGVLPTYRTCLPARFSFSKTSTVFSLRVTVYGRKDEFQCRKKCRQQLRRCPIT